MSQRWFSFRSFSGLYSIPPRELNHGLSNQLPTDGHLKCFQSYVIPTNVAMTIFVDISLCKLASISRDGIAGSEGMCSCYCNRTFGYVEENTIKLFCTLVGFFNFLSDER